MIVGVFENIAFEGISIDSRTLKPGNLFFALSGENWDGHDFIEEAYQKGAAGAVVSRQIQTNLPIRLTKDTVKTLGEITQNWREKFHIPLIGLTGSNGKTTTKNMIGAILKAAQKSVLITRGNLNNHIGVPLMLSELTPDHQIAVIEMGMNHFGEIDYLTRLSRPTTVLITNAGPCHLEGVDGTIAGVAKAKGEIFAGLSSQGTAVINTDDDFADYWKSLIQHKKNQNQNIKIMTYGIENKTDIRGELKDNGFILYYQQQEIFIQLNLLGQHNILNALAAAAVTLSNGVTLLDVKTGLEIIQPEHGRMETKKGQNGVVIIDDTYNANPLSLKAAIESIRDYTQKKILVLGDMRELGEQCVSLHRECGKFAKANGIDILLAMGDLTQHTVNSFGENARFFADHESLMTALKAYLDKDVLILVKGSRSMKMEKIVEAII